MTEEIQPEDADLWSTGINDIKELVERRLEETVRPTWRSKAETELIECLGYLDSSGAPWTEGPYREVWDLNELLLRSCLQQGQSLSTIVRLNSEASLSLDVIARTILELAAQATWLSDVKINGRARVARAYILRRSSNEKLIQTLSEIGVDPAQVTSETPSDLDVMYSKLGYNIDFGSKGGWKGAEGQANSKYTERVKNYMEAFGKGSNNAVYAYMSGAAHGEIWRLAHSFRQEVDPNGTLAMVNPPYRYHSKLSVLTSIEAIFWVGYKRFQMFGQAAALTEMERKRKALLESLIS